YNVTDTNTTITGLSPINEYYTVTIIPVNVIGYGPSVTVNVSITTTTSSITNIMMSTTEYITTQDKSSAMTALPTITITMTETISSCTDTVVFFQQTEPNASTVLCLGDRVEFTCETDIGSVIWQTDDGRITALSSLTVPSQIDSLLLAVSHFNGSMITSTATIESVTTSLNGATIGCSDALVLENFIYLPINVTGPVVPVNVTVKPINNSALFIQWAEQQDCTAHYNITMTSNSTYTESNTVNTSSGTIGSLIIGTNYSFIIIPVSTSGLGGPPSSLIQYIWNVPAQVVNISWYQISTDSVTIWWNKTQGYSTIPVPPTQYYIINVYTTSNSIIYTNNTNNTNVTITGLSPINEYYTVTIIPVNVIGYGPSATVNVSITTSSSSVSS
uniref:Fibronectin type-III domain-containing protein n=1 Tax=Amphimedon queenslandica TaxID=400682 RepID=A0A1X7UNG8_AMPQE